MTLFCFVLSVLASVAPGYSQTNPSPDGVGFIGDIGNPQLTSAEFTAWPNGPDFSQIGLPGTGSLTDLAVDRANRRLYALTAGGLKIYDLDPTVSPPQLAYRTSVNVPGKVLALSLDARTAYIGDKGKVTAVNLYPEAVFESGKSTVKPAYTYVRVYPFSPARDVAAMGVHPAGDRLIVVIDAEVKKLNVRNDLLRSDVNGSTQRIEDIALPDDFGFITQLDITPSTTVEAAKEQPKFAEPKNLKTLISPNVALGVRSLAFSPDGNYVLISAVGAQTPRATAYGILPTSDEGTGGIVVLDVRPASGEQDWVKFLNFIPTTEKDEKTAELRSEIRTKGWRTVHPDLQWARMNYAAAEGQMGVAMSGGGLLGGGGLAMSSATAFLVAADILENLEYAYRDYGYMDAYINLYPRDMVGASGVAINHKGDFGIVALQDTNNLGLLTLSLSTALEGYTPDARPDFYIKTGTGKTVNATGAAYSWAYPQEVTFTSDDSRIYIGMSGGTPKADLSNKFGAADALTLRTERDDPNSPFRGKSPPPGYSLQSGPSLKSPRQAATLNAFDTDGDKLSDIVEAFNRWNNFRQLPEDPEGVRKQKLVSTAATNISSSIEPVQTSSGALDCMEYGYLLPPNGVGYRMTVFGMPENTTNFATRGVVTAIEQIGAEWHRRYLQREKTGAVDPDVPLTRPYFVVGLLSQPGGGVIKNQTHEALRYTPGNGSEADFPYFTKNSDAAFDFVKSNGPGSPRDNSVEGDRSYFDTENMAALIHLLLAHPLVQTIELDPGVLEEIPGIEDDPKIVPRGSLTVPDSRRDKDNHMYVTFGCVSVDLDIDSDNDSSLDGTPGEDKVEDKAGLPGKLIALNHEDLDGDQIPDFADGYDLFPGQNTPDASAQFTPMIVRVPDELDLEAMQFRLIYSESDPAAVARSASPPYTYTLPGTGAYRVWTKNGTEARKVGEISAGGDFIKSKQTYSIGLILPDDSRETVLYIEAVLPGLSPSDREVVVELIPNAGPQSSVTVLTDRVAVTVLPSLLVDIDRNGEIDPTSDITSASNPFRFWLNDDIDRGHTVDGSDWEEDDLATGDDGKLDWQENKIASMRDLEDFARLRINISGLQSMLTAPNSNLQLGLKWTKTENTTPAVKLYPSVDLDGGEGYLNDPITAALQIDSSYAIQDARDTAQPGDDAAKNVIGGSNVFILPKQLFQNHTAADQPTLHLLFEGVSAGKGQLQMVILDASGNEIGQGPGSWMELKKIENFYERWTAGDGNGGDPSSTAIRKKLLSRSGNSVTYDSTGFQYASDASEENKYILYVHGWNMTPEEKNRFAETAFKRLYWQGYKGRFGVFCWPTTYDFGALVKDDSKIKTWLNSRYSASTDPTNYDRGEWTAWKSSFPLMQLLTSLRSTYPSVNVLAHSMGNVVTGEALRRLARTGATNVVDCYVASQAAVPGHCYDRTLVNPIFADVPFAKIVAWADGGHPETPNIYSDWLAENSGVAGRRVNFYNTNDYALWRDIWEANQFLKPDASDDPDQPWTYKYTGNDVSVTEDLFKRTTGVWTEDLHLGDAAIPQNRYEIMAFAAEARSRATGATAAPLGMNDAVDLTSTSIWPDDSGQAGSDGQKWGAHKWHSAQFRSTNMRQGNYWKTLLGIRGFNLSTQ